MSIQESAIQCACLCCGYLTYSEPPNGNWDICPVCFWEDDPVQAGNENYSGGANRVSLRQARKNFGLFGACTRDAIGSVRKPYEFEISK